MLLTRLLQIRSNAYFRQGTEMTLRLRAVAGALLASFLISALPSNAADWQTKVDPWVLNTGRAAETEFLIMLTEQADLSPARTLLSKEAKGAFVFSTLSELAARTQAPLLAELSARAVQHRSYWIANMIWASAGLDTVEAMAVRKDVQHIYANPAVHFPRPAGIGGEGGVSTRAVEWNISKVKADQVWAEGTTGTGAVVGGQDTGYMWNHPALITQYRGGSAGNHDYNWHDAIHEGGSICGADSPVPCDDHDHGTHTMGTIVGDDGGVNKIGMAPGAAWIGCRNMNAGNGTPATYAECYQWFIAPTTVAGTNPDPSRAPHVVNNSWGCPPSEGCTDPQVLLTVVENVHAAGIVTVHSAGNSGSSCSSIDEPAATYDESYTVGATDSTDTIASFSSRGPVTIDGSNRAKPDISAPGVNIRSSTKDGSYAGGWDGTSMAGPHVAGLVALLISRAPGLAGNVDLIEHIISSTAVPLTSNQGCGGDAADAVPNNVYGWGRIDALAAHQYPLHFTLDITPASQAICAPQTGIFAINVAQVDGVTEPVSLTIDGAPANASVSWSNNPLSPPGTSQLTIANTVAVSPDSYGMTVAGISSPSGFTQESAFTLEVFSEIPGVVLPISPVNGAMNQALRPQFAWAAASQAHTYDLEIASDAGFTTIVFSVTGLTETSFTPESDLPSNSQLFWRLRAHNSCGAGLDTASWSFLTTALPGDCGLGTTPLLSFSDDIENGSSEWTHSGAGDTWVLSTARAHSGATSFHAVDPATTSDQRLVSPAITLPSASSDLTLQFWNWQQMEDKSGGCWDGALVEVSTDDGGAWTPLNNAAMLTDPYDGPATGLGNLDGWCEDQEISVIEWKKSIVDIDNYSGQTIRFGFRLGSDSSVGREGWYIDDVEVQSCTATGQLLFSDGFETASTDAWSLTFP